MEKRQRAIKYQRMIKVNNVLVPMDVTPKMKGQKMNH